jgi:hypothetical protein
MRGLVIDKPADRFAHHFPAPALHRYHSATRVRAGYGWEWPIDITADLYALSAYVPDPRIPTEVDVRTGFATRRRSRRLEVRERQITARRVGEVRL